MMNREEELQTFKRAINLSEYAVSCGYVLDRRASSRSSVVMKHANGDKIIVARDHDGHWIFFSVRDDKDNGTIIDFVQHRRQVSLGEVRKNLRLWIRGDHFPAASTSNPLSFVQSLEPVSKDMIRVRAAFEKTSEISGRHSYLEDFRHIAPEVLSHPRFACRIRIDERGNAIFPHWNASGLCGFEIKNRDFTGFSPGGEKGFWASHSLAEDTALVITESTIDALSHFAIRRPGRCRYLSSAGAMNENQPELLRRAVQKLPEGSEVIVATDNDQGGDRLAEAIRLALAPLRETFRLREDRPSARETDWNDVLRALKPL